MVVFRVSWGVLATSWVTPFQMILETERGAMISTSVVPFKSPVFKILHQEMFWKDHYYKKYIQPTK